ncbi:hypothetical protein CMI37_20160 [Candidatus Pacearchaeota archaeon]|nr:hypothetical protein [Candidatus Pacearchaeota archaeon]|tara:strand:- start:55 stop:807 length:753 start_codon:yes stop_codon:yes gene_type:complete
MSRELLKTVLVTKEASAMNALRSTITRALGAGGTSGASLLALDALGVQNQPLYWGLVGGAGVLGHDLAGALASRGRLGKNLEKVSCAKRVKKMLIQNLPDNPNGRFKHASLSRAAKGGIGLPAAVGSVAAMLPAKTLGLPPSLGAQRALTEPSLLEKFVSPYQHLGETLTGDTLPAAVEALGGLGTLAALGVGAGKLSEKAIPVAKKNLLARLVEDPKKRKMLLAASLFPWVSSSVGASYLINKARGSDS